jgi:CO/xanthine dehydrogenase FAD-binding subunit
VIPRPFDYERPGSVEEAVSVLAAAGGRDARLIAGGQSLLPMLSLGLARPDVLVDVSRLELDGIEVLAADVPLLAAATPLIGHFQIRNRGTLGGSLAHADPAAELPVVAVAHGGEIVAHGPGGARRIPLGEFFLGYLETGLAPDEVLVAAELELLPEGSGVGFYEEAQRADDFALACAAAIVQPDGRGRVVVGGVGDRPLRFDGAPDELAAAVESAIEPEEDAFVSAAFRRRLAGVCARRALARAREDAAA